MAKRDILNHLNQKIGELELPDETSEDVWQEKLSVFAATPPGDHIKDVSPRQIRCALILSGVSLNQIDEAIDSLPEPQRSLAKIEWEFSIAFQRNRPLVSQVGQMLGWNSQQLDELWKFAATL